MLFNKVIFIIILLVILPCVYADLIEVNREPIGSPPYSATSLDVDGDGLFDTAIIGTISKAKSYGARGWEISLSNIRAIAPVDLNSDGILNEVVIVGDKIVAVDSEGNKLWELNEKGYSAKAVDIDSDGFLDEVVIGGWNNIKAFDSSGTTLWTYADIEGGVYHLAITKKYIVAGAGAHLYGLRYDGHFGWSLLTTKNIGAITSFDLTGAGELDGVAVATLDGRVNAYTMYGVSQEWNFKKTHESGKITIVAIDKNSKGRLDHIALNQYLGVYWINNKGSQVGSASIIESKSIAPIDFDGDGILDDLVVVKASLDDIGKTYAFDSYSREIGNFSEAGGSVVTSLDFDLDGKVDDFVTANEFDTSVHVIVSELTDVTTATTPITTPPPTTTTPTTPPPQVTQIAVELGPDRTIVEGESVTITAQATPSSSEGKIVSYIWTEEGKFLGDTQTITLTPEKGTHNITVKVTDNVGASATDNVLITVQEKSKNKSIDSDNDGLTDEQEELLKTDPHNPDSDGDGLIDSQDPNPLIPQETSTLPSFTINLKPLLKYLKWIAIAAVGIFLIIYIREKILDFLWERQQDWGE